MSAKDKKPRVTDQIVEVQEASYDPEVGQSVSLAVRVATRTRRAAADVNVTFKAESGPTEVCVTDEEGWATFVYKATAQGNTQVTAVVNGSQAKTASHTFEILAAEAGVWDFASISLNDPTERRFSWGAISVFPRNTPQTFTITTIVPSYSPILEYDVHLGLSSELSLAELGITNVSPALGVARPMAAAGMSWTFTVDPKAGGAFFLSMGANRLINQSAANHMSLGPNPPEPVLAT